MGQEGFVAPSLWLVPGYSELDVSLMSLSSFNYGDDAGFINPQQAQPQSQPRLMTIVV
jgi:hypothetical protein